MHRKSPSSSYFDIFVWQQNDKTQLHVKNNELTARLQENVENFKDKGIRI